MAKNQNAPQSRQDKIAAATPKQKKTTPIIAALIVVVVLAAAAWAVISGMGSEPDTTGTENSSGVPRGAESESGGIVLGTAKEGAPRLDIYEDPQCPHCATIHGLLGNTVNELAESGRAKVVIHVKTFMDSNLRNDSSKRSANGMMCAADLEKFQPFHDSVLENQSPSGDGWTDAQLEQLAQGAGITGQNLDAWKACQSDKTYDKYLAAVEDATARDGVNGTPLYRVNGKEIPLSEQMTGADLEKAITDAGGEPAAATPATSPSN
ncbi:MAG: thioredoxin domain-containing protein [Dermatophilus congolensis]|nr:thioredoxin domain-containing protein [Dermatophilus congolensis]